MPLVIKHFKPGPHPRGTGYFFSSYGGREGALKATQERLKLFRNWSKEKFLKQYKITNMNLGDDAWIIVWEDEPETNEFGVVSP
jgi:hypothetical protein